MPASKIAPLLALILFVASVTCAVSAKTTTSYQVSTAASVASSRALAWLASNQFSNGSYGPYSEVGTAPAAYALWLNNSQSLEARAPFTWLASELDDGTSGIWYEADLPGEVLYCLSASGNLGLLSQQKSDSDRLLAFQDSNGGFKGFSQPPNYTPETSSVDTAMALLGLVNSSGISSSARQSAINYLFTLQNRDGSFNLTRTVEADKFYSLGPEPVALTALVTLAFKASSYPESNNSVSKALNYLAQPPASNFTDYVYASSLSALAFFTYGRTADSSSAISHLISRQASDGSFRDSIRFSTAPNPLDTGWAAVALQLVKTESQQTGPLDGSSALNPVMIIGLVVGGAVVIAAGLIFFLRKKKPSAQPAVQTIP